MKRYFVYIMSNKSRRLYTGITSNLEKALAVGLAAVGYDLINRVNSRAPLDPDTFTSVVTAFASRFPIVRRAAFLQKRIAFALCSDGSPPSVAGRNRSLVRQNHNSIMQ